MDGALIADINLGLAKGSKAELRNGNIHIVHNGESRAHWEQVEVDFPGLGKQICYFLHFAGQAGSGYYVTQLRGPKSLLDKTLELFN